MPNKRNRFGEKWSLIHYHSKSFRKYKYWSRDQLTAHFGIYYVPPYIQTLNPRRFLVWLIEVVRGNIEVYQPTREYQKDFFKRYHKAIKEATRLPNGLIDEKSISPEFLPYYKHLLRKKKWDRRWTRASNKWDKRLYSHKYYPYTYPPPNGRTQYPEPVVVLQGFYSKEYGELLYKTRFTDKQASQIFFISGKEARNRGMRIGKFLYIGRRKMKPPKKVSSKGLLGFKYEKFLQIFNKYVSKARLLHKTPREREEYVRQLMNKFQYGYDSRKIRKSIYRKPNMSHKVQKAETIRKRDDYEVLEMG